LIIAPFHGALINIIAGAGGSREGHMAAKGGGRMDEVYVPPIIHMANPADGMVSAQALLDPGAITRVEFDQLRQRAPAGS
jgi:hypothetical protein